MVRERTWFVTSARGNQDRINSSFEMSELENACSPPLGLMR